MKYLIAGLGNIGDEYNNTRHNIGFKVLDALAEASNSCFNDSKKAFTTTIKHKGRVLVLIKPTTYMNLSGKAVSYYLQKEKIKTENLLVISDDLALPFGKIRLKGKGSHGGHNGLRNICETLGTNEYPRLRFGISNDYSKGKQVDYVLGDWDKYESEKLDERINTCTEIIKSFCSIGLERTMNLYNNK